MSYEVGTYVDLRHLNVKSAKAEKSVLRLPMSFMAVAIDAEKTRFRFMPARRIPVAFA